MRNRFLRNFAYSYQVPASVPCDRTMLFSRCDALYLEGMVEFLTGKHHLPASVGPRFWCFDLPVPSKPGVHTHYDIIRTHWTVSYCHGSVIACPEHDAFRIDESPNAGFDVGVAEVERRTQYGIHLDRFPALPNWIKDLRLPGGLCIRLPRSLLYFGSEVARPKRFSEYSNRMSYSVWLEMARRLANAIDLDYFYSGIV